MEGIDENNVSLLADSYKYSHWLQLPPGMRAVSAYLEARGGPFAYTRFFGLQSIVKRSLLRPVTERQVRAAGRLVEEHGEPFNLDGWLAIVRRHDGRLPVQIDAVPEGTDVTISNVLMRVANTDADFPWLPTFLETILQQVWAPSTVCTLSAHVRDLLLHDLERTCEDPQAIVDYKLHDFGLRGVANMTTGGQLGLAHLVNFLGTDTVPALIEAIRFYGAQGPVGFSIPAGEHSEILAWGREREGEYFENLFARFLAPSRLVAGPIDTYDMTACLEQLICGRFLQPIKNSGGTFVARPDSGDPVEVVPWVLKTLARNFGTTTNAKGYHVLHPSVRVIFGDAMTLDRIRSTNAAIAAAGFSIENVTYGMGGGLLQKVNRDIQQFAIKASAVEDAEARWRGIRKTVSTDPAKASKAGRLALVRDDATQTYETVPFERLDGRSDLLRPIYRNGKLLVDESFDVVRARARAGEQPGGRP